MWFRFIVGTRSAQLAECGSGVTVHLNGQTQNQLSYCDHDDVAHCSHPKWQFLIYHFNIFWYCKDNTGLGRAAMD